MVALQILETKLLHSKFFRMCFVGPVHHCYSAGLAASMHALRHFVRWKHPRVFVSEHSEWDAPQVYEVYTAKLRVSRP